jgi:ferritin
MSQFTQALNEQIALEFAASQQYVAMAIHYDAQTLPQLAARFYRQAVEERNHAMMIVRYLLDSEVPVRVPGVEAPQRRLTMPRAGDARARTGEAGHGADCSTRRPCSRGG